MPLTADPATTVAVKPLRPRSLVRIPGAATAIGVWTAVWYGPSLIAIGALTAVDTPMFQRLACDVMMVSNASPSAVAARLVTHGSRFAAGIAVWPGHAGIRTPLRNISIVEKSWPGGSSERSSVNDSTIGLAADAVISAPFGSRTAMFT